MKKKILLFALISLVPLLGTTAILLRFYSEWSRNSRGPYSETSGSSSDQYYNHIATRVWKSEDGKLYYAIAVGYMDFEPIIPEFTYSYTHGGRIGGRLIVNGSEVKASHANRLLALNPFGEMQEIILTDSEAEIACSRNSLEIWNKVVLPRLYRFRGAFKNGQRTGRWVCCELNGRKAFEGEYLEGKRHGLWVYYYHSGAIRSEIEYVASKRHGKWKSYLEDGSQTDLLTWNYDIPVERPASQAGLGHADTIYPNGNSRGFRY